MRILFNCLLIMLTGGLMAQSPSLKQAHQFVKQVMAKEGYSAYKIFHTQTDKGRIGGATTTFAKGYTHALVALVENCSGCPVRATANNGWVQKEFNFEMYDMTGLDADEPVTFSIIKLKNEQAATVQMELEYWVDAEGIDRTTGHNTVLAVFRK